RNGIYSLFQINSMMIKTHSFLPFLGRTFLSLP
ncbi:hypothetical protein AAUPMB_21887, partial [Pasteurella multocida subsp. multocida str. Anand1_buffalo]